MARIAKGRPKTGFKNLLEKKSLDMRNWKTKTRNKRAWTEHLKLSSGCGVNVADED